MAAMSDALARLAGAFLLESLADAIRVESMEDGRTFVLKDGAAMSMIRIDGALRARVRAPTGRLTGGWRKF